MVGGISSGIALKINAAALSPKVGHGSGAKLDLGVVAHSKVRLDAAHTIKGKGLKIDIKA